MIDLLKTAMLSAVLVSSVTIVTNAANTAPLQNQNPPQVAANPDAPDVNAGQPGANTGHWVWIPSNSSPAAAAASAGIRSEHGSFYSKKGWGPSPN
jgi:hypothetical protein